jgi:hypothetical protein
MVHDRPGNQSRRGRVCRVVVRGVGGLLSLDQIAIAFSGVVAVWLTQDKRESWRRWACIFGMLGQPFWFYAAWKAEQWGIFALCALYTYAWARGFWMHWLSPYVQIGDRQGPAKLRWLEFGGAGRHMARPSPPR